MPEISRFFSIRITMYYDEHRPPHFHAEYNGQKAEIDIRSAKVIKGALPNRQLKHGTAWAIIHQEELLENWNEIEKGTGNVRAIDPLR
mgnify:FL=1